MIYRRSYTSDHLIWTLLNKLSNWQPLYLKPYTLKCSRPHQYSHCFDFKYLLLYYLIILSFYYLFIILIFVYAFVQVFRMWSTGWLRQWRCSSQHKFRYLFLDKGQAAKNLKQSKDSVLVWINSLWNFYWDNQFIEIVWKFFSNFNWIVFFSRTSYSNIVTVTG